MNPKRKISSIDKRVSIIVIVIVIFVLLLIQGIFQVVENKKNANQTAVVLLDQIVGTFEINKNNTSEMINSLKEEYIIRAKTVAYMLKDKDEIFQDVNELNKIADLVSVDEIHVFNENGVIFGGTNPEYYGYDFDSGKQLAYFKLMLENKNNVMCQGLTANTVKGKDMMYAMVWMEDGSNMIQVGIEPKRLLKKLNDNSVYSIINNIPIYEGFQIYVVDKNSNEIKGSTNSDVIGKNLYEVGLENIRSHLKNNISFVENINDDYSYCNFREIDDYYIGIIQSCKIINKNLFSNLIFVLVYLCVSALIILNLITENNEKLQEERDKRLKEQEIQNNTLAKINNELADAVILANAANKAKSTFLFNMSHDIRTPMNAILGYTELAYKYHNDPKRIDVYLNNINEAGQQLLDLINDVLEMSRIENGVVSLNEVINEPGHLAGRLKLVFANEINKKHQNFIINVDENAKPIYYDETIMSKILLNLVSNAIKYTPQNGTITYSYKQLPSSKKGYCIMESIITDTGIGMSEEFLSHAFETFSREKTSTVSGIQGTGLGLGIVKGLVDRLYGTIEIKSKLNEGTSVILRIPHRLASGNEDIKKIEELELDESILSNKRILLAEDNDLNAEIAMELLEEHGLKIERAKDGNICLSMLENADENYYDLILMDIQMPNMDGYTATRAIRRMDNNIKANIPIIAMTANAFEEDRQASFESGMNAHISKPINIKILIETIISIIDKK